MKRYIEFIKVWFHCLIKNSEEHKIVRVVYVKKNDKGYQCRCNLNQG